VLGLGIDTVAVRETAARSAGDADLRARFPRTHGRPAIELVAGRDRAAAGALRVGVVLSGGQAPGGHNVIVGLADALRALHPGSKLLGFLGGPKGILVNRHEELTAERVSPYRNSGGFDMIGSGRDKIESDEDLSAGLAVCRELALDGLVVVGGDDSNTNAAVLAEHFAAHGCATAVVGVPKTIDGDLKGGGIEASFGFDTATKVYAELIGNICRDARSAGKYWHFIRLMGRSASHVTLECALAVQPTVALVAEEVERRGLSLDAVADAVADVVRRRADAGRSYGVCLVPEGLIEFVPEMRELIAELNGLLAADSGEIDGLESPDDKRTLVASKLSRERAATFRALPPPIQRQLLIDRDAHGNVQVSRIETESLILSKVSDRVKAWSDGGEFRGKFAAMCHFFGYEGRCAAPSNFDADYTYALGRLAAALVAHRRTGYVCALSGLAAPAEEWSAAAIPLTSLLTWETRRGRRTPVIRKALVQLDAEPFATFARERERWQIEDAFVYPGPIQYFGPPEVCSARTRTLELESSAAPRRR
jgi:pyrophosphate--fructose-6-phosphate 1-phosphotransferase